MDLKYTEAEVLEASTVYFDGDELAAKVFKDKYALADVVDGRKLFAELTPDDMHRRLAREFARMEGKFAGLSLQDDELTVGMFYDAMAHFRYIVPQGSVMFGSGNAFVDVSLSNCVVVKAPDDSWSGIQRTATELGNLFKRRAGVGVDISSLRPEGMKVNNAAITTSGAWSFADHFSNVCRTIGQNGRRGALMLSIDVRHPDVEAFAKMKRDTTKVTGANVSVFLTDEFMHAVEEDAEWVTRWPVTATVEEAAFVRIFRARALWHTINESAWLSAEPGLLFADSYKANLPAHYYAGFEMTGINPCAEIALSDYDSCRLISLNLKSFVSDPFTVKAKFDLTTFVKMVRLAVRMSDNLVELEIEALTKIIEKCDDDAERELWCKLRQSGIDGRRIGLGTHGLADVFLALGLAYDGDPASVQADIIYATLRDAAYCMSVELATERGPFPAWLTNAKRDMTECSYIKRLPVALQDAMLDSGRRNIALLTVAPTGTVSLVSQTSSGVEPVFEFAHTRKKKIEAHDSTARVDSVDALGDKWQHFEVSHHSVREFVAATGWPVGWAWGDLPDYFVSSSTIDPMRRVELQGVIQKYIDHGISSTINLPASTTIEAIEAIYMAAWKHGLKGVTVYRDGCRSGVLVSSNTGSPDTIHESRAPKRPKVLKCSIHREHLRVRGNDEPEDWTFLVGLLDGQPYEVFGGSSGAIELPRRVTSGRITKRRCEAGKAKSGRSNCYDLILGEGDDEMKVRDIASVFSPDDEDYGLITRIVSQELRHGVNIHHIVDQLGRSKKAGLNSFSKVLARVLKKFIKAGAKSGENCECGAKYVFEEGCQRCADCGNSKCN